METDNQVLDFQELSKEKGLKNALKFLRAKLSQGFQISILFQSVMSMPQTATHKLKKNSIFSQEHQVMEIHDIDFDGNEEPLEKIIDEPPKIIEVEQVQSNHDIEPDLAKPQVDTQRPYIQQEEEIKKDSPKEKDFENDLDHVDAEMVNLLQIQDNKFVAKFKECSLHKPLEKALNIYKEGKLFEAINRFQDIIEKAAILQKESQDHFNDKIYGLIQAQSLCYQAQIFRCQGQYEQANKKVISILERCLKSYEINEIDIITKILQELALNNFLQSRLSKAQDCYFKSLIIFEQMNWKLEIAKVLVRMALIQAYLGNHDNAKKMCYEALAIYKKKIKEKDLRVYEAYQMLGNIFYLSKEYEFAMQYLLQSFEGKKNLIGDKDLSLVKTLNLMGIISHLQGNLSEAIEFYEEAIIIYKGQIQVGLAQVLNNLGLSYMETAKLKSAKLAFSKALEILKLFLFPPDSQLLKKLKKNLELVNNIST